MITERQEIIRAIQALKADYKGMRSAEFSKYIYNACAAPYKDPEGKPTPKWQKIADEYLREMRLVENFIDTSKPYFKT